MKASANTQNRTHTQQVERFLGVDYYPTDLIELFEFWGDIEVDDKCYHDVVVTLCGDKLAKFEANPFWGGKPFVIGTCIPLPRKVYGLGLLEPVLGMLHQLNIVTNQRLDNLEISVDQMWEAVADGTLDPDDVFTKPGKVIQVAALGNIRPIPRSQDFTISYTEAETLQRDIDRTVGLGAYIGTQQGRSGERVTAAEIQAVRDAGGNRLSSIHRHVEQTQLLLVLKKMYRHCQQFLDQDETVRLPGEHPRETQYVVVGPEEFLYDLEIEVQGADHVADKEFNLQKVISYIQLITGVEEMRKQIDWGAMTKFVTQKFGFGDDEKFVLDMLIPPQEEQQEVDPEMQMAMMQAQMDPATQMTEAAGRMAGQPGAEAMQAKMMQMGSQAAVADEMSRATTGQPLPDEMLMQLQQAQMMQPPQ